MFQKYLMLSVLLCTALTSFAQNATLRGRVIDPENNQPLGGATVVLANTGRITESDSSGNFELNDLEAGNFALVVTRNGHYPQETATELIAGQVTNIEIPLRRDLSAQGQTGDIPTLSLDDIEDEIGGNGGGDVANLLAANYDVYRSVTSFGWFPFRFRERGYDSDNFPLLLNGVPVNDAETGFVYYGEFGGLNDVLRNRESTVGLNAADFAFGGLGGVSMIDTRASRQRKQLRVSYASTNRIYRNRIMATYSTGLMPKGWAVTVSGSRRWAQEGYTPGTFFDGWGYFLSVDKVINKQHALNFTFLGAPTSRGRSADSYQEMYDIAGTNYYNPLWGFWNGEKRNSQVATQHQPLAILRYDWTPDDKTAITAAVHAQGGRSSFTRLNWLDAPHPAPDFNRRLPSSLLNPVQQEEWTNLLSQNEELRQINWFELYDANSRNFTTVENVDGIEGNNYNIKRALYIVEDQRTDSYEQGVNIFARHTMTPRVTLNGGFQYAWYTGKNFKTVDDLLGADYWLDNDFYSIFDPFGNTSGAQSDLQNPNNLIKEGETFGYNYDENIRRGNFWGQGQFSLSNLQFFAAADVTNNVYWRTGYMQNGRFPNNSLGDSDKQVFNTYNLKGGVVWKLNGRHYLYANGLYGTRAPRFQDTYLSPRTRDVVVPNVDVVTIQSVEGGYILRAPKYRVRVTGFVTDFLNETDNIFANAQTVSKVIEDLNLGNFNTPDVELFLNAPLFFGSATLVGQDRRHMGVEAAVEAKIFPAWVLSAAGTIGKHVYTNRPDLILSLDNNALPLLEAGQVYQKNFYVPRTPQSAATFEVKYESKQFWFASLAANFADAMWYDFDRIRRTTRYVEALEEGTSAYDQAIDQIQAPSAFTLDFFAGKSWKINDQFIYLNVGINNLLNNQDIVVSGRESYRNAFRFDITDPRFYTTELIYAPGINYFASITFRL
jgi:hypothetical protein